MARIVIDFDQVMSFGDRYRDVAHALDNHRNVLRGDAGRLDAIVVAFRIGLNSPGPHFHGMSISNAMADADARAGRVAHTLMTTSSRVFAFAGATQRADLHFSFFHQAMQALSGPGVAPFGFHLWGMVGGEIAGWTAEATKFGFRISSRLGVVVPIFAGVTGLLDIIDGITEFANAGGDTWLKVAGALRLASGATSVSVALLGGFLFAVGVGTGAAFAAAAAPILLVAGVLGAGALLIENRHEIVRAVRTVGHTVAEVGHNLLHGVEGLWNKAVDFVGHMGQEVRDAAFSEAEAVGDLLHRVFTHAIGVLHVPINPGVAMPGAVIPLPGAHLGPGGVLQGSSPNLQRSAPRPSPAAVPAPTVPTPGLTSLPNSNRTWQEAQEAYDRLVPGYVGARTMYSDTLGGNRYQCVSWAWFRLRELGYKGPIFTSGTGGRMAGMLGGTTNTEPKLGAVVSSAGHVFVVEEVQRDASGHVIRARYSEMNSGLHADGSKAPDYDKDGNFIQASADEFRCDHWIVRNADGTYSREGHDGSVARVPKEALIIANPDYGGAYG